MHSTTASSGTMKVSPAASKAKPSTSASESGRRRVKAGPSPRALSMEGGPRSAPPPPPPAPLQLLVQPLGVVVRLGQPLGRGAIGQELPHPPPRDADLAHQV